MTQTYLEFLYETASGALYTNNLSGERITPADICILPLELLDDTHESGAPTPTRDTTLCVPLLGEDGRELATPCERPGSSASQLPDAENNLGTFSRGDLFQTSGPPGFPLENPEDQKRESAEKVARAAAISALGSKLPELQADCQRMLERVERYALVTVWPAGSCGG